LPFRVDVEEPVFTFNPPPEMVDEAVEMKPERVERPVTFKVDPRTVAPADWRVPEAFKAPATWRPAETDEDAFETKPLFNVARPKDWKVPVAETFPEASTEKRPRMLSEEVATLNELAVRVEVVVPSVTWKMFVPLILPTNVLVWSVSQEKRPLPEL
jgi:hypothetical protein